MKPFNLYFLRFEGKLADSVWISLNRIGLGQNFKMWSTGADVSYENWAAGEPSKSISKDCVAIKYDFSTLIM
jgi:hypothetical protein